jgi:hypothetical protein
LDQAAAIHRERRVERVGKLGRVDELVRLQIGDDDDYASGEPVGEKYFGDETMHTLFPCCV